MVDVTEVKPMLPRTARLTKAVIAELFRRERQIEATEDLQTVTLVIRMSRQGRPRTVLFRAESKTELQTG